MPKAPEPSSTCQKTTKSLPRISPKSYCYNAVPNRFSSRFSTSPTNGPRLPSLRKRVHTRLSEKDRTQLLTRRNRGRFGWGWYHYSRSVPHVHQHPRAGYQNGKLCRFWGLVGCSQRTQKAFGTAMRLCASLFRGVAAPLDCVILFLLSKLWLVCHALRIFPRVRDMGGITALGVLCVLPKRRTAACQSG